MHFGMRKNYTYPDPEKAPKPKKVVKEETSTDEKKVDTPMSRRVKITINTTIVQSLDLCPS